MKIKLRNNGDVAVGICKLRQLVLIFFIVCFNIKLEQNLKGISKCFFHDKCPIVV